MKKRLVLIMGLLMLVVGGYAAAAMVSVQAERTVSTELASDLNNAAIKFTPMGEFKEQKVLTEVNGVVAFDLTAVLKDNVALNKAAKFEIGNVSNPVFTITNNLAKDSIHVGFKDNQQIKLFGESKALSASETLEIKAGEEKKFYFVVETTATDKDGQLSGKLFIK